MNWLWFLIGLITGQFALLLAQALLSADKHIDIFISQEEFNELCEAIAKDHLDEWIERKQRG